MFTLTVTKGGSGKGSVVSTPPGINCDMNCPWASSSYNPNTTVTLTATPASGSTFTGWSGNCSGTGSCTVTMSQNRSVTAAFQSSTAETVSPPNTPTGPASGTTGASYSYTTGGSISNLGHAIEYQFDWKGDGSNLSSWGSATQSNIWTSSDSFDVRARARCSQDTSVVSGWSDSLNVSMVSVVPDISVSPMSNDFGTVKVRKSKTASFKVKNSGKADLVLNSEITGTDSPMFLIAGGGGSKTIKPGKTLTMKVTFKPTSKGSKSSTLRIASNDPDTPIIEIPLSGTGQ